MNMLHLMKHMKGGSWVSMFMLVKKCEPYGLMITCVAWSSIGMNGSLLLLLNPRIRAGPPELSEKLEVVRLWGRSSEDHPRTCKWIVDSSHGDR